MNKPVHAPVTAKTAAKPSSLAAFLRGCGSGVVNGALMLGIFSVIGLAATGAWPLLPKAIAMTIATTGIFSGIMGVRRAHSEEKNAYSNATHTATMVPVISQGVTMTPSMDIDQAPETKRGSWVERTGSGSAQQTNVDKILANGSLSDTDRASAILAERERANTNAHTIH